MRLINGSQLLKTQLGITLVAKAKLLGMGMECSSFCSTMLKLPLLRRSSISSGSTRPPSSCKSRNNTATYCSLEVGGGGAAFSYRKFVQFALDETKLFTPLSPSPLQENYRAMMATDGKTELQMLSFQSPKIRLLRSLSIEGSDGMQVLDFAVFPEAAFDLPIFCANFFTSVNTNIVVLDLNPLYDVINQRNYKEKYYTSLIPLGLKYAELLPWGGKLTSESLRFFSPIVIWTKFSSCHNKHDALYSAFMDYYRAWLGLMDQASAEMDSSQISCNREAQHRYLTWRSEKDPGQRLLKRLVGENLAKDVVSNFLFHGINELGTKTFLDYFPEYKREDGTVNEKRSIIGKSFEERPWDSTGQFIGNSFR